ncbi:MAG: peptide deformylase [Bacteroidota bacterium]
MAVQEILLLGNPVLRKRCTPVRHFSSPDTTSTVTNLRDTLLDFRSRKGFGRGIAAPQIGMGQQVIYIDFEYHGPLMNPRITKRSRHTFRLWDDCFSFPDILVNVRRNTSIVVEFRDEQGTKKTLKATGGLSELLQHEIDHLNGVLAIDRAIDSTHIVLRSEFEKLSRKSGSIL